MIMTNPNYQINPYLMSSLVNHLNQLTDKYSKLLPIRLDFSYQVGSPIGLQRNNDYSACDIRRLLELLVEQEEIAGYAWVMEYTELHGIHFHTVLYLNGQLQRNYYPLYEKANQLWQEVTYGQGNVHDCNRNKASYEVRGLNLLDYYNDARMNDFVYALSYLAKEEQKEFVTREQFSFGLSEVPLPSGRGRPRALS